MPPDPNGLTPFTDPLILSPIFEIMDLLLNAQVASSDGEIAVSVISRNRSDKQMPDKSSDKCGGGCGFCEAFGSIAFPRGRHKRGKSIALLATAAGRGSAEATD